MGMGEPLYNFEAVRDALAVVQDGDGLAISRRRITLSTSGVVPMIERAGAEIGVMLAISLHAVRDELRDKLVPLNRKYPIAELLEACRNYPGVSNARRITFEYVMLKGVNDSLEDAKALVRLLKGIPAKINLIPFNPWPGSQYECSDWDQIEKFSEIVFNAGYASPVRTPRGRDILAACGQLKSATEKLSRPRAAGAARHGDDGLSPMIIGRFLMRLLLVPFGGCVAICVAMMFVMVAHWNRIAALTADDYSGLMTFFVVGPMLAVGSWRHAVAGDARRADRRGIRDPLLDVSCGQRRAVGRGQSGVDRRVRQGLRSVRRAADRGRRRHRRPASPIGWWPAGARASGSRCSRSRSLPTRRRPPRCRPS